MKVLILEDEALAAEKLKNSLLGIDPTITIVSIIQSVESGVDWLSANPHPDLIFSDIQLLDGLCFDIFKKVSVTKPVVFTTAFDQYAIKAFEQNSIDYLLKPIKKEALEKSLKKYKSLQNEEAKPVLYDELIRLLQSKQEQYKSRFMVKIGQKIVSIPIERIAYFFSEAKLTFIVTDDGKRYPVDQTLEVVADQVDPAQFFRVNRQFIVHFNAIAEMHPYFKGRVKIKVTPESPHEIVISSDKTPEFKKWLDQ